MKFANTKGNVYYGLHFYEGPCQYNDPEQKKSYKVCLKEAVLRDMDASFMGRPVFVEHVAGVDSDLDVLRTEADGWVVESFFNQADGKHWVKFIVVSEKGEKAVADGMKLSNCYVAKRFGPGSLWNAIPYEREILEAEFEHLAIVPDPRYQESVIMTPDQFRAYNDENFRKTEKYANANKETETMFFTKTKVDKTKELEGLMVMLPKSKVEIEVIKMINAADEWEIKKKEPQMADPSHMVEMKNGEKCTVGELMEKHNAMCNELADLKSKKEENDDGDEGGEDGEDGATDNSESEEEKSALKAEEEEKKQNELAAKKAEADIAKEIAKEKAERLKNAGPGKNQDKVVRLEMGSDRAARGKARYGS